MSQRRARVCSCAHARLYPDALACETIRLRVNRAEMLPLQSRARAAHLSLPDDIRKQLGLTERTTDKPILEQIEDETDQAWTPLRGIGLYPPAFLPEDDSWMDEYCPRSGGTELGVAGTSQVGLTIPDYVHTQSGFDLRFASNLGTEERDREEDDAWDRLYGFWLNPKEYFLKG